MILATVAAVAVPRAGDLLQVLGARDAAGVVAAELEQARTLAARLRVPVRISCDCASGTLIVTARDSGEELRRQQIAGGDAGMGVDGIAFSVASVDVFPSGVTSGALTVTVTTQRVQRRVVMTSAGLVRVIQ